MPQNWLKVPAIGNFRMRNRLNKSIFILLCVFFCCFAIQYIQAGVLRKSCAIIEVALMVFLTLFYIDKHFVCQTYVGRAYLIKFALSIIVFPWTICIGKGDISIYATLMQVIWSLFAYIGIMIGYNCQINTNQIKKCCLIFIFAVAISSFLYVKTTLGSIAIYEQYAGVEKNALGQLIAAAHVLSLLMFFKYSNINKYILLLTSVFLLILVLCIRARLATVGAFFGDIIILFIYFFKTPNNLTKLFYTLLILSILISASLIFDIDLVHKSIRDFVYNSFFLNKGEDLSSGRITLNLYAIETLLSDPLWGNITVGRKELMIHNYVLNTLFTSGLIGAAGSLFIYVIVGILCIKNILVIKSLSWMNVGYILVLMLYIGSLGEPCFPFSPGSAVIFQYFLLGVALKSTARNKLTSTRLQ